MRSVIVVGLTLALYFIGVGVAFWDGRDTAPLPQFSESMSMHDCVALAQRVNLAPEVCERRSPDVAPLPPVWQPTFTSDPPAAGGYYR